MINLIRDVHIEQGPDPWAASVHVRWRFNPRPGRKKRHNLLRKRFSDLHLGEDYNIRYDDVMDVTIVYFRDKVLATTVYFELA